MVTCRSIQFRVIRINATVFLDICWWVVSLRHTAGCMLHHSSLIKTPTARQVSAILGTSMDPPLGQAWNPSLAPARFDLGVKLGSSLASKPGTMSAHTWHRFGKVPLVLHYHVPNLARPAASPRQHPGTNVAQQWLTYLAQGWHTLGTS